LTACLDGKLRMNHDSFNLARFLDAQAQSYDTALAELKNGRKQSHWMWYIFPQLDGLGHSVTAKYYALKNLDEAQAYFNHLVLGQRLIACSKALLAVNGKTIASILGFPDDLKLHSSMTLFSQLVDTDAIFQQVIDQYFASQPDQKTLQLLNRT
jgi:uncharacterized protein (DUF1810 family)